MQVILPYDPCWGPLKWIKDNCKSYTTNNARHNGVFYDIVYYFSDEKEALLVILKFGGKVGE